MKIIIKKYEISGLNSKIIHISDLHYYKKSDIIHLNKVLESIKNINPDYICITGDLTNESNIKDEEYLLNWLSNLSSITTVLLSIGNHEFYMNKSNKMFGINKKLISMIKKIDNLYLLDNDNIKISNINFIGFTQPIETYNGKSKIDSYLNKLNIIDDCYNILLCHSPMNICNSDFIRNSKVNLILCGHMHGGVVPRLFRPIFKTRGLVSPNKKLFPKYAYGNIKINNTNVIITSGIKVIPDNLKVLQNLFSSEIVIIN